MYISQIIFEYLSWLFWKHLLFNCSLDPDHRVQTAVTWSFKLSGTPRWFPA